MSLSTAQDLTVAFVLHNEAHQLKPLLESLVRVEEIEMVREVLFIDNASTDETLKILRQFQALSSLNVTVIARQLNHMGQARGDVLAFAKTKWVLFCDGDCLPPPSWLKGYFEVLQQMGPSLGTLYAGVGGPALPLGAGRGSGLAQLLSFFKWTHLDSPQGAIKDKGWDSDHLPCSNAMLDRELILENGGFCSSIEAVGEDLELGLRLSSKGYAWRIVPALQIHHQRDFRLHKWAQKMLSYGRAQVRVGRIRRRFHGRAVAAVVAAALGVSWILLLLIHPVIAFVAASAYAFGLLLQLIFCPKVGMRQRLYGLVLVPSTHIFYALGALMEFVAPKKPLG